VKEANTIVIRENLKSNWQWYVIAGFLLLIILLLATCNGVDGIRDKVNGYACQYCEGSSTIDTMYVDTGSVAFIPHYVVKTDTMMVKTVITDTFLRDVDTAAILRAYFLQHYYTIPFDTLEVKGKLRFKVWQNKVLDPKLTISNYRPTVIHTENEYKPVEKVRVWMGVSLSARHDMPLKPDLHPSFAIQDRKGRIYMVQYGTFTSRIQVTGLVRIGK